MPLTTAEIERGLERVRLSPQDEGTVELIVRRPDVDRREVVEEAYLEPDKGLVGDNWLVRGSSSRGAADPARQITLTNARFIDLVAEKRERWALAGDQLYVDFDLGVDLLPAGSRVAIGSAVLEVSEPPHTGCGKFSRRFGADALRFVNSPTGRQMRLRGLNARVLQAGSVRRGDSIRKL